MKEVAILLVVTLLLNGCGTTTTATQTAASGLWYADLLGGAGPASGFSFNTQFTVSGGGRGVEHFELSVPYRWSLFPSQRRNAGRANAFDREYDHVPGDGHAYVHGAVGEPTHLR